MKFIKYQHLERFGTSETEGIEFGETYIFPKLDGTNASIWLGDDGQIKAGSRNRELSLENDNAGFYAWVLKQECFKRFFNTFPYLRLFGEWLVPHSLNTYKVDAWRSFYVFDIAIDKSPENITHEGDSQVEYLMYDKYKAWLELFEIPYIAPISIIRNGNYDQFIAQLQKNVFLIEDGKGVGEGIVIKNYDWKNKYGRQTWAKIVTSEFKEKHAKVMGAPILPGKLMVEREIAQKYVTTALVDKEYSKIVVDAGGWTSKHIPRLLNTVFYSVVKEETWEFVKEHKNPTINFKTLQHFVVSEIKAKKPEIF